MRKDETVFNSSKPGVPYKRTIWEWQNIAPVLGVLNPGKPFEFPEEITNNNRALYADTLTLEIPKGGMENLLVAVTAGHLAAVRPRYAVRVWRYSEGGGKGAVVESVAFQSKGDAQDALKAMKQIRIPAGGSLQAGFFWSSPDGSWMVARVRALR